MPTVELSPEMGIEASAELKVALSGHLDAKSEIVLAAPEARRVHTATLQVLTAFFRARTQAGHKTRIEPCADPLRDAAVTLGLADELGLSKNQPKK